MQSVSVPPRSGKVAFQQGLLFGLVQAMIDVSTLLLNVFFLGVSFLTGLAASFASGILASKQTGKVSTGVFAGMWTGTISGVIGLVVRMVLLFQGNLPELIVWFVPTNTVNAEGFVAGVTSERVISVVFGLFVAVGLGTGLGALGGLIGRSISQE